MSGVCEQWSLEDLVSMTEKDMDSLLNSYEPGKIPTLEAVQNQ